MRKALFGTPSKRILGPPFCYLKCSRGASYRRDLTERAHSTLDQATHNKIVSYIWGIADDVLRDLFKRGKYPDVILPMCVIRRMDAVLEPTKRAVLDTKLLLD